MRKWKGLFGIFLAIAIVAIVLWYQKYCWDVEAFNKNEYVDTMESPSEYVNIEYIERIGQANTWEKPLEDGKTLTAKIYDFAVHKDGQYNVPEWKLRINVKKKMYINNAWCGTVEFHQFVDGKENVQTLDLRSFEASDVKLKHLNDGKDVLIPLEPGDYMVYNPSGEVFEMPIETAKGEEKTVTIGFIFYFEDQLDLSDTTIYYHLSKSIEDGVEYNAYRFMLVCWVTLTAAYIVFLFYAHYTQKSLDRKEKMLVESFTVFSNFVDAKDSYTSGHSKRVAEYSKLIAERLKMSKQECMDVYYIALMHDCGKCKIPDEILKKPDRLTDKEYEVIKSHTTEGAKMLENFNSVKNFSDGAMYHHERYDGKGYPMGIAGEEIPLIGRIICVADSFDAMASKRVYRNAFDADYIRKELKNCAGTQFDPVIIEIFIKLLDDGVIKI